MFDLDGVVYVDGHAVDHAAEGIAAARDAGAHIAFITNNASRTPEEVAAHLRELGVDADLERCGDLVPGRGRGSCGTHHGPEAPIAVLGAQGLVEALTEAGLQPVEVGDPRAVAVVSGYAPDVRVAGRSCRRRP